MRDQARALQMLQETRAEANAFMRAFDQAGNISHNKRAALTRRGIGVGGNHTQMRLQGSEGIRRDFGPRRRDARDQRGLSCVRETDKSYVGQQFKFEAQREFFAGLAVLVFARSLMPGSDEMRVAVASAAVATLSSEETLAGLREIEELLTGI